MVFYDDFEIYRYQRHIETGFTSKAIQLFMLRFMHLEVPYTGFGVIIIIIWSNLYPIQIKA